MQMRLAEILGVQRVERHDKYLGMPTFLGRNKSKCFSYIKDRLWKRLQGWKGKLLSAAGKEVLVKAIAQAIPTYTMSCFLLPKQFCEDINRLIASFWWDGDEGERKLHWCSWEILCIPKSEGGLGFRDILAFNMGMLAKQGWRIINEPHSLVAQVLKAKYFPHGSFMEATVLPNASYCWKSICAARKIITLGARWQVGSGSTIRIWEDPWLPTPTSFRPFTTKPASCSLKTVDELIDPPTNHWNHGLLSQLFSVEEIDVIRSILLSRRSPPYYLIWHYDKRGKFTVRSAYHIARSWLQPANSRASSSTQPPPGGTLWSKLWNANVSPKVKICVWRLSNELCPTRVNLNKRHVTTDLNCTLCNYHGESTIHVMKNCLYARCAWLVSGLGVIMRDVQHLSFLEWITEAASLLPKSSFDLFLMTCWALWGARNAKLWNGEVHTPDVCVERARQWWIAFGKAKHTQTSTTGTNNRDKWTPPLSGELKVNVDGAWNETRKKAGFGAIIRDGNGDFVKAMCGSYEDIFSPLHAELVACREAVYWAVNRGYQNLCFETDSLQIVEALKNPSLNLSIVGQVVEDIKALLHPITEATITHTRRNTNNVAHRLARIGLSTTQTCEWNKTPPSIIHDLLVEDSVRL